MIKSGHRKAWMLICLALALTGCSAPPGDRVQYMEGDGHTWPGIDGYVTVSRSGPARPSIQVRLYKVTETVDTYTPISSTTIPARSTDPYGYYNFTGLDSGTYVLEVQSTSSFTGTRYQHIVFDGTSHVRADLITPPNFIATSPTATLPHINKIAINGNFLQNGTTLTGNVTMNIDALPGSYGLKFILVKIGHFSNGSDFVFDDFYTNPISCNIDTTKYNNGKSFIYVVAYDTNDNSSAVNIPVYFNN